jgi:hypothetical protein
MLFYQHRVGKNELTEVNIQDNPSGYKRITE